MSRRYSEFLGPEFQNSFACRTLLSGFSPTFVLRMGTDPVPTRCVFMGVRKAVVKKSSCLRHVRPSGHLSSWNNATPIDRALRRISYWEFSLKVFNTFRFCLKSVKHRHVTWRPTYMHNMSSLLVVTIVILYSLWDTRWGRIQLTI
jgi:hypothetical protein